MADDVLVQNLETPLLACDALRFYHSVKDKEGIDSMWKNTFSMLVVSRRLLSSQNSHCNRIMQEKLLMEPYEYVQKLPCKHHTLLPSAYNHWLQVPEDKLERVQKVCRDWMTWLLLLEDIQDNSLFRYGFPAAYTVFGVGVTINAANQTLLLVQKQIAELGHPLAPQICMKRTEEYLYGQGIDLYWQDKTIFPTIEEHIIMTRNKTGGSSRLPVDLLQLFSNNQTDFTNLANDIASYYEIVDDYYNLLHPKAITRLVFEKHLPQENYGYNSDITEGKITLPIIHASQFPDVATELADILKQRTRDPVLQNRVIELVKKHGSDEYTRNMLRKFEADIRAQIYQLGGNPIMTAFMDDLSFQSYELPSAQDLY